ncbi:MAG TPA: ABC transporter permease subunit [Flavobacterium sp.]|jgi:ABC-type transport system involved in multi-copper enzyme maturation permease subunit
MKRLISIELQKITKNKASVILTICYFVLLVLTALLASFEFKIFGATVKFGEWGAFNFPFVWHAVSYVAAILKLFLAIIIVSMMANEYSYGTLKQNLIDGMSKKEFILSKFYTICLLSLISTIVVFIITMVLGFSFSAYDEMSIVFTDADYLLAYFVKLVAFFSFCMFLGILVKRSAFALGFLIIWNVIEFFIGVALLKAMPGSTIPETIYRFLPLESMSNLILNPARRFALVKNLEKQLGGAENTLDYSVDYTQVAIVLGWIVIFVLMSYKLLKKRDL